MSRNYPLEKLLLRVIMDMDGVQEVDRIAQFLFRFTGDQVPISNRDRAINVDRDVHHQVWPETVNKHRFQF